MNSSISYNNGSENDASFQKLKPVLEWLAKALTRLHSDLNKITELSLETGMPVDLIRTVLDSTIETLGNSERRGGQENALWRSLLVLMLAKRTTGQPHKSGPAMLNKNGAAAFLGISKRKLECHMNRRQLAYYKYGAGRSATVRFSVDELISFRDSRNVKARRQ